MAPFKITYLLLKIDNRVCIKMYDKVYLPYPETNSREDIIGSWLMALYPQKQFILDQIIYDYLQNK